MDDCGFIPLMLLSWVSPMMKKGFEKPLELSDLGKLSRKDSAAVNYRRLHKFWTEEVKLKGMEEASIGRTLFRTARTRVIFGSLLFLCALLASFVGPVGKRMTHQINQFVSFLFIFQTFAHPCAKPQW